MAHKKVLIYDTEYKGHHLQYVAYIISAFVGKGCEVIFATHPDTVKSVQYRALLKPMEDRFKIEFVAIERKFDGWLLRILLETLNVILISKRTKAEHIFLPWLDPIFFTLGLFGRMFMPGNRGVIEGILFRGDYAYESSPFSVKRLVKKVLARAIIRMGFFSRVLFLDILAYKFHLSSDRKNLQRFSFCPECVEDIKYSLDVDKFRQDNGIPLSAKLMGCVGVLDERKGTHLIVKAFSRFVQRPDCYLLLMGKVAPTILKIIKEIDNPRIIVIDKFVSDEELAVGIDTADIISVLYANHVGSSQILIRAAAAGKPVVASDYGVIGYLTEKYKLGLTVNVTNNKEMNKAMIWAFESPQCDLKLATSLAMQNTVDEFKQAVTMRINSRNRGAI